MAPGQRQLATAGQRVIMAGHREGTRWVPCPGPSLRTDVIRPLREKRSRSQDRSGALAEVREHGSVRVFTTGPGMLTGKYLDGIPAGSRAAEDGSLRKGFLNEDNLVRLRALNEIAAGRGQTLAQMAIVWVLRDSRVTTALVGASQWSQIDDSLGALNNLNFAGRRADCNRQPCRQRGD